MSGRKDGWYWVQVSSLISEAWEAAKHLDGQWFMTHSDGPLPDGVIHTVGPRIPTPDEAMALVPREITAETGHKAGMIGDFEELIEDECGWCDGSGVDVGTCEHCHGSGAMTVAVPISWTTIKAIHRRIVEIAEAALAGRKG